MGSVSLAILTEGDVVVTGEDCSAEGIFAGNGRAVGGISCHRQRAGCWGNGPVILMYWQIIE